MEILKTVGAGQHLSNVNCIMIHQLANAVCPQAATYISGIPDVVVSGEGDSVVVDCVDVVGGSGSVGIVDAGAVVVDAGDVVNTEGVVDFGVVVDAGVAIVGLSLIHI